MARAASGLLFVPMLALAQAPAFEVASIRPATDQRRLAPEPFFCAFGCFNEGRLRISGSRVDIGFMPLDQIIVRAHRIRPDQLSGPDWMHQQRFDILANLPEGAAAAQVPEMLQKLLADRFKLAVHREMKEQPVYALSVDRNGPRLKPAATNSPATKDSDEKLNSPQGPLQARQIDGHLVVTQGPWGPMRMSRTESGQQAPEIEMLSVTMPLLADAMTQFMDRPVIDKTGLEGAYEIWIWAQDMEPFMATKFAALKGSRPPSGDPAAASDPAGGSTIFKNMEKLGLKLERTKLPVEILIVDHLEKTPTEN
ncbi:MAG: TIGR03435 family protein [Bryobacterales bacterium]|nr:TIGR03435 family protein [Bryobacterales bacterium]MBV9397612.1 TIGR03435 family protein [Bryobacterales bacterium]